MNDEEKMKEVRKWIIMGSCMVIIFIILGIIINGASAEYPANNSKVEDIVHTDIEDVVGQVIIPIKETVDGVEKEYEDNQTADTFKDDEKPEVTIQKCTYDVGEKNLTVHILDVEHGDSILIQGPNGGSIIIDGGYEDKPRMILDHMRNLSVSYFDYVIATHMHSDHIGGLDYIMKKIGFVYEVYDNGQIPQNLSIEDMRSYNSYRKLAEKLNRKMLMGDKQLAWDECVDVQILIPYQNKSYNENMNDNSLVVKISFFDQSFLFMGDCEHECEQKLLAKGVDLKADVLKVGHHGDRDATGDDFLDVVDPSIAVISAGDFDKFGHPHVETLDRLHLKGIDVLRTDEGGHVIIKTDGENVDITRKLPPEGVEIWS